MPVEQNTKSASTPKTGRFATLFSRNPADAAGEGALKTSPDAAEGAQDGVGQGRSVGACSARDGVRTQSCAALCGALALAFALFALAPSAASAGQARLFGSFGASTSAPANPYPLSGAQHVAVDSSSHDVYVVDGQGILGNHRVEKFDSEGHFLFMFGAGVLAAGAEGTGTLTTGSKLITSVTATERAFLPEEEITGAGIPPETTIAAVGIGTLTLSKPASASGAGVALDVAEGSGNVPDNERQTIALGGSPSGGSFTLRLESAFVEGATTAGSNQVTATTHATGSLHVGDATNLEAAEGRGTLTAGSPNVTSLLTAGGRANLTAGSNELTSFKTQFGEFLVGQPIAGEGIPAATTIATVGTGTLTLSKPVEAGKSGTEVHISSQGPQPFGVGQPIEAAEGKGIPAGTTIASVGAGTLTLSAPAVSSGTEVRLRATKTVTAIDSSTGSFALSANSKSSFANSRVTATETTAPIPHNATSAKVAEALEALPGIGSGNVSVSGSAGGPWTVEFKGPQFADANVPQLSADASPLTPSGATATVSTTLQGHSSPEVCHAQCQPATGAQENGLLHSPLEEPGFIAVDPSSHDVYLSNSGYATKGLVDKFDPSGNLIETWGDGGTCPAAPDGQLSGSCATKPAGPFGRVKGIAVDPSGYLWVGAGNTFEFDSNAKPLGGFTTRELEELAVDSEDNLYTNFNNAFVNKFLPSGEELGVVAPSKAETEAAKNPPKHPNETFSPTSFAVDASNGELYVVGREGSFQFNNEVGVIKRYDSSCHPAIVEVNPQPGCAAVEALGSGFVAPNVHGLAIDSSSKALYLGETTKVGVLAYRTVPDVVTKKPVNPTATSATFTGTVNPSGIELNPGAEGCRFEWAEVGKPYEHTEPCSESAAEIGSGSEEVEVKADVTGLEGGKSYHYRLVASNKNDENPSVHQPSLGADLAFGPPLIESASALSVSSNAAELQTEVNARSFDTHVGIEYVTQAHFDENGFSEPLSTAKADIGSAGTSQAPIFELTGLASHTAYRYRVVAENALGETAIGPELTFATQATGPFSLPDSRQWEMVSPPRKLGARIEPIAETGLVQAAASGGAITYLTSSPTEAEPEGYTNRQQILSTRGASAWSTRDIGIPHPGPTGFGVGTGTEYKFFDPELSLSAAQPFGEFDPALSPEASEQTAFLHDLSGSCGGSCYHPLVTAREGFANVPEGTQFGGAGLCTPTVGRETSVVCGPEFDGASEDLRHVVLHSNTVALAPGAALHELFEWSAGALAPVSVLPGPGGEHTAGRLPIRRRGAISAEGSRIVWESFSNPANLYLRDTEAGHEGTLQLDAKEAGCGACESGGGEFQLASPDGSRVFFADVNRLTANSGAVPTGSQKADLYECRIEEAGGKLACALTDLTPKQGGESAAVQGDILGASQDGSYLYFVANGVLASNEGSGGGHASPGNCHPSAEAAHTCNLYLLHEGTTTYIATLSGEDDITDWGSNQPTRVSPKGQWLALMSQRPLTGYDNRDLATGRPVAEVYLYHAADGKLVCASCDPTGARPHGVEYGKLEPGSGGLVGGPRGIWRNNLVAANVPGSDSAGRTGVGHQPRYLNDEGRLFFDTVNALVPQDSNANQDVYEYEPPGVGGCAESSPTFGQVSGGCVGLISQGTSREESAFLDASESGEDVFFLTDSKLVPADEDAALDVYDAHACSAESPCLPEPPPPAPACQGDACQPPATPPNDPTPGSLTFHGAGNVHEEPPPNHRECPKGKVLKHGKCVPKKHKAKHKKRAHKRANSNRGGAK